MTRVMALVIASLVGSACVAAASADPDHLAGRTIFRTCASCHGKEGQGGVGPALTRVLATFPDCADHVEWIRLGSDGWLEERGDTYGANNPVEGGMPSFGDALDESEIRQVALYERVRFGGSDEATERAACGL